MRFDPRGVLAVLSVVSAFAIQGYLIYQGNTADMPPWVVGLVSAIVAFYFGYKASENGSGPKGHRTDSHDTYAGGRGETHDHPPSNGDGSTS